MKKFPLVKKQWGFCKQEINLLKKYLLGGDEEYFFQRHNIDDYIRDLLRIRLSLKLNIVKNASHFFESDQSGYIKAKLGGHRFQYSYQRWDLISFMDDWLEGLYNITNHYFKTYGLFVNSGMSSFLVSMLSARNLFPFYESISLSKSGYFEINDLLTMSFGVLKRIFFEGDDDSLGDIIILDSSSYELPEIERLLDSNLIIIDTSCWELGSKKLADILGALRDYKGLILLLRSHIKLDCFGLEVGRLGSIVVLSSLEKGCLSAESFHQTCQNINGNIGTNFQLSDYYPWLLEKKFQELSRARTELIRTHNAFIYNKLKEACVPNLKFVQPQHNLYTLIKFSPELTYGEMRKWMEKIWATEDLGLIKKFIQSLCFEAKLQNISLLPAPSFGLCYSSIDGYWSKVNQEFYMRVAPSANMNLAEAERIAQYLTNLFSQKKFNYGRNYKEELAFC